MNQLAVCLINVTRFRHRALEEGIKQVFLEISTGRDPSTCNKLPRDLGQFSSRVIKLNVDPPELDASRA
jgi:hypothetical protein